MLKLSGKEKSYCPICKKDTNKLKDGRCLSCVRREQGKKNADKIRKGVLRYYKTNGTDKIREGTIKAIQEGRCRKRYVTPEGILLDSTYECYFYNYCKLKGYSITRGPKIDYFYQGKKHTTLIDFCVNNNLYEIKGMQLKQDVYKDVAVPYKIKEKVYKENNVTVITDITPYICDISDIKNYHKKTYKKVCPACKKEFITEYASRKYCSISCSNKMRDRSKYKNRVPNYCPICGKLVSTAKTFCSDSCKDTAVEESKKIDKQIPVDKNAKTYIHINYNNNIMYKYVYTEFYPLYKKLGWKRGKCQTRSEKMKSKKWVNKQGKCKRVDIKDVEYYTDNGWRIGRK